MSIRMNPGVKALWIAALMSGSFKQVNGGLCKVNDGERKHCCLGVLTDLAVAAGALSAGRVDEYGDVLYPDTGVHGIARTEQTVTPRVVAQWAGLVDSTGEADVDPYVDGPDGLNRKLSEWNDGFYTYTDETDVNGEYVRKHYQLDFDQIAGLIARNL